MDKTKKPEITLINIFFILFLISFLQSKALLTIVGAICLVWSIVKLKDLNFFKLLIPVLPFIILMSIALFLNTITNKNFNDHEFYLKIMYKLAVSSIVLSAITKKYTALFLLEGIMHLGFPKILNNIFALTFRYFYMIDSDIKTGHKAMLARGVSNRKGSRLIFVFGEWLGGFFLKSSIHAELVHKAMLSRGLGYGENETKNSIDKFNVFIKLVFFILILVIDWSLVNGYFS